GRVRCGASGGLRDAGVLRTLRVREGRVAQRSAQVAYFRPCSPAGARELMHKEYHRRHSPRLGREMGIVVYGHWGPPLLAFPTSGGDEWEHENQGMIGALGGLIDAGRVKIFSVNSLNFESFYDKDAHPVHRSY